MLEFLLAVGLIWIVLSIVQDFRTREVANWLNFSLIIFALAFRLFYSVFSSDYKFFIFGLFGLGVFLILGHLLYYSRLFAGGDAKLFIALGAIIPLADNFRDNNLIFIVFVFALLFGGAVYSLIYSFVIAFKNKKEFSRKYLNLYKENVRYFYSALAFSASFIIYALISREFYFFFIPFFLIGLFFLYVYAKAVEQSCMLKMVSVNTLRVGDWLEKEIRVKGKIIKPNWEGLSQEDVDLIKKSYKNKVLIKEGIPFTPAFLIAFLVILYIKFYLGGNFGLWGVFGF